MNASKVSVVCCQFWRGTSCLSAMLFVLATKTLNLINSNLACLSKSRLFFSSLSINGSNSVANLPILALLNSISVNAGRRCLCLGVRLGMCDYPLWIWQAGVPPAMLGWVANSNLRSASILLVALLLRF